MKQHELRYQCAARGCREEAGSPGLKQCPFCPDHWKQLSNELRESIAYALWYQMQSAASRNHEALTSEIRAAALSLPLPAGVVACRVCGCTEDLACAGGCHWTIAAGLPGGPLCSMCVGLPARQPKEISQ